MTNDDFDDTIACPQCQRQIHEESVACPGCGHYLTDQERSPKRNAGGWIILIVILVVVSLLFPLIDQLIAGLSGQ